MLPLLAAFALHAGDTVLFYGDSITEQQLYTVYVEDFVRTRYPGLNVRFYNRGWGGDRVTGGAGGDAITRVDRDVKPISASVVTVMLGMNDGGYSPYNEATGTKFDDGYGRLLGLLHRAEPHARFTLIETSPYDDFVHSHPNFAVENGSGGYNDVLLKYGQTVKDWADKDHDQFVDFNSPLATMLMYATASNPSQAAHIVPDSVHPGPAGHLVMAAALVEAWGATPTVSDTELDAAGQTVVKSDNCEVSKFDGLRWTSKEGSLPFIVNPDDASVKLALSSSDLTKRLNQETLQVRHLLHGDYELFIDGTSVGKFSADQLGDGINLAEYSTPMSSQALEVLSLVNRNSHLDFTKWRQILYEEGSMHNAGAVASAMDKLENDLYNAELAAAQPKSHSFELKAVTG